MPTRHRQRLANLAPGGQPVTRDLFEALCRVASRLSVVQRGQLVALLQRADRSEHGD